jgi:hypothetical protein
MAAVKDASAAIRRSVFIVPLGVLIEIERSVRVGGVFVNGTSCGVLGYDGGAR